MLKNAHLLRYPAASPSWRRGKTSLLIRRDATPHPFGGFLHLPACRSLGAGRGIFEHPGDKPLFQKAAKFQLHAFTGHGGGFSPVSLRDSQDESATRSRAEVGVPPVKDRRSFGAKDLYDEGCNHGVY